MQFDPGSFILTLNDPVIKEMYSNGKRSWTACIYAFAYNGASKTIKVTVR